MMDPSFELLLMSLAMFVGCYAAGKLPLLLQVMSKICVDSVAKKCVLFHSKFIYTIVVFCHYYVAFTEKVFKFSIH